MSRLSIKRGRAFVEELLVRQLGSLFCYDGDEDANYLHQGVSSALEDCRHCFSRISNKYYRRGNEILFNPFHAGQYGIFLYFFSRHLTLLGADDLADRIYSLNRALHGVELYHQVVLPKVFFMDHPLGSILGRAIYSDYFSFGQAVTVGNHYGKYPHFGKHVSLMAGAQVIGDCKIGSNVVIGAGTFLLNATIPDNSIVFGRHPNITIRELECDGGTTPWMNFLK